MKLSLDQATPEERALILAAVQARERAYAPYSHFKVGAALRLADGRIVTGVNVENVSYGLTVCAERNAIAAAVRDGAVVGDLVQVAVGAASASATAEPVPPCGACRQVLAEFATASLPVLLYNIPTDTIERCCLGELLPHGFAKSSLP